VSAQKYQRIAISFEKQETDLRAGEDLCAKQDKIGEIVQIDLATPAGRYKRPKKNGAKVHPSAVVREQIGMNERLLGPILSRVKRTEGWTSGRFFWSSLYRPAGCQIDLERFHLLVLFGAQILAGAEIRLLFLNE